MVTPSAIRGTSPVTALSVQAGGRFGAREHEAPAPLHRAETSSARTAAITALPDIGADPCSRTGDGWMLGDLSDRYRRLNGTGASWLLLEAEYRGCASRFRISGRRRCWAGSLMPGPPPPRTGFCDGCFLVGMSRSDQVLLFPPIRHRNEFIRERTISTAADPAIPPAQSSGNPVRSGLGRLRDTVSATRLAAEHHWNGPLAPCGQQDPPLRLGHGSGRMGAR